MKCANFFERWQRHHVIKLQLQLQIGFCPIVHLAAPWRRMPVVLKEDLGLSSLGLTGSRGMLQYGVAFMKIISRRSNDRLFDNPICGETYMTIVKFSESRHSTKPRFVVGFGLQYRMNVYLLPTSGVAKVFNLQFSFHHFPSTFYNLNLCQLAT